MIAIGGGEGGSGGARLWRTIGWGGAAALLALPALAMRFAPAYGVDWTAGDFVAAALLLGGLGLGLELAVRASSSWAYRTGAALAVLGIFLLVWINLAVGIIGSEDNPANAWYLGVVALLAAGALATRFRAGGLAWTLAAAAIAQAAIAVFAAGRRGIEDPNWPLDIVGCTAMFVLLWLASAALFARAAGISRRLPQG